MFFIGIAAIQKKRRWMRAFPDWSCAAAKIMLGDKNKKIKTAGKKELAKMIKHDRGRVSGRPIDASGEWSSIWCERERERERE